MTRRSLRYLPLLAIPLLLGAAPAEGGVRVEHFFLVLVAVLAAGKIFGELAERLGQPSVLGELLAGVVLGASMLGVLPSIGPLHEVVVLLAEVGVALLLFEIGLETDLKEMFRVGPSATVVAIIGVAVPFALGFAYWSLVQPEMGAVAGGVSPHMVAIFVGATLTATSVGITARVLTDLKRIHTREARVIIGAAVVDDVLGLVILAIVSALAAGAAITIGGVIGKFAIAVGFLAAALVVGNLVAPRFFALVDRMRVRGVLLVAAFCFALVFAALAGLAGSALIIGSFAAGLVLSGVNQFDLIEERIKPVVDVFTPIFFVSVGASVNVALFAPWRPEFDWSVLGVGGALLAIAIVGKIVSGYAVGWSPRNRMNHLAIGVGMIPRGEVGLIFAHLGLSRGILTTELFSAILIMVMFTTFIVPPLLKPIFAREAAAPPEPGYEPALPVTPAA